MRFILIGKGVAVVLSCFLACRGALSAEASPQGRTGNEEITKRHSPQAKPSVFNVPTLWAYSAPLTGAAHGHSSAYGSMFRGCSSIPWSPAPFTLELITVSSGAPTEAIPGRGWSRCPLSPSPG